MNKKLLPSAVALLVSAALMQLSVRSSFTCIVCWRLQCTVTVRLSAAVSLLREESQRIADVILSRRAEFLVFTTYIGHYDRSMTLLEDSCRTSPAFAAIVHQFEVRHSFSSTLYKCFQKRHLEKHPTNTNSSAGNITFQIHQIKIIICIQITCNYINRFLNQLQH